MLKEYIPAPVRRMARTMRGASSYRRESYAQEGEDLVLARLLEPVGKGFYVDVGAHHPFRFSNTFLFYRMGWRGINIDAMPGSMRLFRRHRRRDINLEIGIAERESAMPFFMFEEPAYNTFDHQAAERLSDLGKTRLLGMQLVLCRPLREVLARHLPAGQRIDFLAIDAEGLDPVVLSSNDWNAYRPRVVVIEMVGVSLRGVANSSQAGFLRRWGYAPVSKTANSVFFTSAED